MSSDAPSLDEILALAAEILEVPEVTASDNWFAVGGDSFGALQLAMLIEETWGGVIDVNEVVEAGSLGEFHDRLVELVQR